MLFSGVSNTQEVPDESFKRLAIGARCLQKAKWGLSWKVVTSPGGRNSPQLGHFGYLYFGGNNGA